MDIKAQREEKSSEWLGLWVSPVMWWFAGIPVFASFIDVYPYFYIREFCIFVFLYFLGKGKIIWPICRRLLGRDGDCMQQMTLNMYISWDRRRGRVWMNAGVGFKIDHLPRSGDIKDNRASGKKGPIVRVFKWKSRSREVLVSRTPARIKFGRKVSIEHQV